MEVLNITPEENDILKKNYNVIIGCKNTHKPMNEKLRKNFVEIGEILEKNEDIIGEDYPTHWGKIQKLYDKCFCNNPQCICSKDRVCAHPVSIKYCKNFKKFAEICPTFHYFLDDEHEFSFKTEMTNHFIHPVELIKSLLVLIDLTSGREKKAKGVLMIGDVVMQSRNFLNTQKKFTETVIKKFEEFLRTDKLIFDRFSEKLGIERNILEIWLEQLKN